MTSESKIEGTYWTEMRQRAELLRKDPTLIRGIITDDDLSRARQAKHGLETVTDELRIEDQASPYVAAHATIFRKPGEYTAHVQRIERLADERAAILQDMAKRPWLYDLT